jgi:hypothetical protein
VSVRIKSKQRQARTQCMMRIWASWTDQVSTTTQVLADRIGSFANLEQGRKKGRGSVTGSASKQIKLLGQ